MAGSILQSVRGRRNGRLHDLETNIEEQIESLRAEISALAKTIGKTGASEGSKIRYKAEAGFDDLIGRSDDLLRTLQDSYLRGAREMRSTVRRHPVATVGAAAAFGIVLALIARR